VDEEGLVKISRRFTHKIYKRNQKTKIENFFSFFFETYIHTTPGRICTHSNEPHHSSNPSIRSPIGTIYTLRNSQSPVMTSIQNVSSHLKIMCKSD